MKMRFISGILFILVIALVFFVARHRPNTIRKSTDLPHVSLRLKWLFDPGFAGEMVAAKEGFFQKHGLEVGIRPGGFESDPIKLVASGSDTFGVVGADTFVLARSKGVPIVAFAAGYIDTAVVYYSRKDANIRTPEDWKGKRVGIQAGQDTETIYRVLLSKAGLSSKDVKEIPVKFDFGMFLRGEVDVWPGYAATQSYILNQSNIAYQVISPAENGVHYLGTVYFTTESTLKEHPEWVQSFVEGVIEGWEFTYSNEAKAISDISSYDSSALTYDLVRWNLRTQKNSIHPEGRKYCEIRILDLSDIQKALVEQKLLEKDIDLNRSIDTHFLSTAYSKQK